MAEVDFSAVDAPASTTPEAEATRQVEEGRRRAADDGGAPPAPTVAALDAVLPSGDDIEEEYRGKPLKDILRVAKQHKEEAKRAYTAGGELNAVRSRAEMAEAMLRVMQQQQPQQPRPDPQAFVQSFVQNPTAVLETVTRQQMAPMMEKLNTLEQQNYWSRAELARERARQNTGINAETWEMLAKPLASIIHASNGDPSDSKTWADAFEDNFKKVASQLTPKTKVGAQGEPPVGQARSTPAPRDRTAHLSARQEGQLEDLASTFNIKKGTKAWDKLVKDIASDPVAMGGIYE